MEKDNKDKKMNTTIKIENVQSVRKAEIVIEEKSINIKYGYNGLGKSSIGKAIDFNINKHNEEIDKLAPFSGGSPVISLSNTFNSCMSFNRDYISKWLFQGDSNVINESYSIFFNDDSLVKKEEEINSALLDLSKSASSSFLNMFVEKINKISGLLKFNKDKKTISGSSTVGKGFKNGPAYAEKISKSELKEYSIWINNSNSPEWFSWFNNGANFALDERCPYCAQKLPEHFDDIKNIIASLIKENDFKKNNTAKQIIIDLSTVTDNDTKIVIESINTVEEPLSAEQQELLAKTFFKAEVEKNKIESLMRQNRFSLRNKNNKEDIKEYYVNNKLDLAYFCGLEKELKENAVKVNNSIDNLLKEFDDFYDLMKDFNSLIIDSINNTENEINTFLKYAGIPYVFNINVDEKGDSHTMLKPLLNKSIILNDATQHLSYGEMNVLSLALFGAIAKRKKTDLIILDDPISSFDENKKFSVIHYLFNETNGVLKDKTVILLTHDMEPLLDIIKNDFIRIPKKAHLLINNKGEISEKEIRKCDIQNVINAERNQVQNNPIDYLKIIHLRRYYDLIGTSHKEAIYQVLSNAEHLRKIPKKNDRKTPLESTCLSDGVNEIRQYIPSFDYSVFITNNSLDKLILMYKRSNDNYDKIRLIRPILDNNTVPIDDKLKNFIYENYHVENLFLYTVLGVKQIPDYIIGLCDEIIQTIEDSK